jgi:hypothetical protein
MKRAEVSVSLLCLLAFCGGCEATRLPASVRTYDAGVELPSGAGRQVLVEQCLICHELTALELFKDFYDRDNWKSLIISMRANGAEVDDAQVEVLSDYLAHNFGIE